MLLTQLALAFEFVFDLFVDQAFLFDLSQPDHFVLSSFLKVFEVLAGAVSFRALLFEVGFGGVHFVHDGVEVIEFDGSIATRH